MSLPRQIIPGRVYMVTRRCTQRQFLLRPDAETTNAFLYCLAVAVKRAEVDLVAFLAHSNHHHTIVVDVNGRMPEFLETLHKLVAKHQNVLRGRRENFWAAEATSVVELPTPDDVFEKMIYALTNPVKDHVVDRADQWPGASSLNMNLNGDEVRVTRPSKFFRKDGPLPDAITLTCVRPVGFEHLSAHEWRERLEARVRQVERAARESTVHACVVAGDADPSRQDPMGRPKSYEPRRTLSPRVSSSDKAACLEVLLRNKAFVAAYHVARTAWKAGGKAVFPAGTYWLHRFAGVLPVPDAART